MAVHEQGADPPQPKEVELAAPVPASWKLSPPSWLSVFVPLLLLESNT